MLRPRNDLRDLLSLRNISIEYNYSLESEGSIKLSLGLTTIICSLYGPNQPKYNKYEEYDRTTIEIKYKHNITLNIDLKILLERKYEEYLVDLFNSVINIKQYPKKLISLKLSVIRDNGSLLTASILACTLALIEGGINMFYVPIPITCAVHSHDNQIVLDPDSEEETICQSLHTYVFNIPENFSLTNESNSIENISNNIQLTSSLSLGSFTPSTLVSTLTTCKQASIPLKNIIRETMKNSSHQFTPDEDS